MIIIAFCLKKTYRLHMKQMLISVAETHRKFEPMLADKGSSGSDWLNVLDNQRLRYDSMTLLLGRGWRYSFSFWKRSIGGIPVA